MDKSFAQRTPTMIEARELARTLLPRSTRNWLRSPSASMRWLWDDVKFFFGIRDVIEMQPGWSLTCHPAAYRCAYFAQKSDPEQVEEFESFVRNCSKGMILLDIGAHFGLFSFAALHYGGPTARAIAIDPSPLAVRLMNVQARLNHSAEQLQIIQAAVSDRAGWKDMVSVGVLASGYYVTPTEVYPQRELSQTKAVTLDDLFAEFKATPTHIKIDVEGHEAAVLRGGKESLSQLQAPIVFLEVHNQIVREFGGNPEETLTLLKTYGYEMFTSAEIPISDSEILSQSLIRIIARKHGQ